ncbi:mechanosensitive ion channel family protein [Acidipila rosea]|uniref:Small-conductance mechanosensitive channel n=1 Tax=Acidipila rosea TaxID=768535 RepID=A0A4R1L195_9BACT|nr:mechanosensitive ion channel domain-containing protein [Acidipila rosea]MBW4027768.1 mechanosensitive ion channel [Acidobacteriota bacterium]MBW4045502.1 mechanosensitive ion channel [Acidobacteriota bacterium]TCK70777.1 small-conductance mechanosensitive channel [Acidipila rosea]
MFHSHGHEWVLSVVIFSLVIVVGLTLHDIVFRVLGRFKLAKTIEHSRMLVVVQRLKRPARWMVVLTGVGAALPFLSVLGPYRLIVGRTVGILWLIVLGWLAVSAVYMVEDIMVLRYDIHVSDNLRARRVRTQLQVLRRLAIGIIILIDLGLVLSIFRDSQIWHYGAGLLASAGLASLVLATAAKSTASNLLAGIQIALTEPIRIDDVVVIDGEWGRIEEITTAYVVVAIWDLRRLIVPLSFFIENSFQNWTRHSADLLGTAFVYVDYSIPIEPLRAEFNRVLEASPIWDRKVGIVQVTNLDAHTMELRFLLSASNSSDQFNLRCLVREAMITYIQKNYPDSLPVTRFRAVPDRPMVQPPPAELRQG